VAYHNPQPPPPFAGCIVGIALIGIMALCGLIMLVSAASH
jgi:hypothetical protein